MMCYGVVGVVVGLLVGGIFLLHPQLRNVHGGCWGLISFLFAACASLYGLLRWKCWPCLSRATILFVVVGAGGIALGTVMFVLYIVLGATDNGECHNTSLARNPPPRKWGRGWLARLPQHMLRLGNGVA